MTAISISKRKMATVERNCRIVSNKGKYEVYSDTKKYGKNQLMYRNSGFAECVEYIQLNSFEKSFEYNYKTLILL